MTIINFKTLNFYDIALIIILVASSIVNYNNFKKNKSFRIVSIYYNNKLLGNFDISKPKIVEIKKNCTAEIRHNKIRMKDSDCPDRKCVKQGWSDLVPIICLPNQVVIEINDNVNPSIHLLR